MPALRELQAAMRDGLLAGDRRIAELVLEDRLPPAERLQIYTNHVRITLTDALAAAFPVVRRLVGEGFFKAACVGYIRSFPPAGPCLFEYGADFPAWLRALPSTRALPYLADVAHLEWAISEAWHAPDAAPLSAERLAELAALRGPELTLALHPAVRLVASLFPIDRIWQANQEGADPTALVDLADGGRFLLVQRRGEEVAWRRIDGGLNAFLRAIRAGFELAGAQASAAAHGPFDLQATLVRLIEDGVLAEPETPN
jgi:hypothetical protein